jgi:hypothetical protein
MIKTIEKGLLFFAISSKMKKTFFFICFLIAILSANAQSDSWEIKLNGKLILSADREDKIAKLKNIKVTEWKKSGFFEIIVKEAFPEKWIRSFQFQDEQETELLRKDSVSSFKIPGVTLYKLFKNKKEIRIYTTTDPKNPMMMAPSHIVHLCTLRLK